MRVVDVGRRECGCVACAYRCVWVEKERKKKHLLMGLPRMCMQRRGHADDHVGVWMRMCCVWMWMSIKEKEEEKNLLCWCGGGRVGLRTCCVLTCWRADADGGGCWWWTCMSVKKKQKRKTYLMDGGCGWWWMWWMRMVTDTDVADSARAQDLDNFVRVYTATTHY